MQPTVVQPNNNEVVSANNSEWLNALPSELLNIIPESLWVTLTVDQKKEVLRQNGLLEKYSANTVSPTEQATPTLEAVEVVPSVLVQEVQKPEMSPEFQKVIEEFKEETNKGEQEQKPVLSKEEIARIEAEKASNANSGGATYKFFGYQPSQNIYTNATKIADDGDVVDAKTWAATLIAKIFGMFER